jgi:hypothetical protein
LLKISLAVELIPSGFQAAPLLTTTLAEKSNPSLLEAICRLCSRLDGIIFAWRDHVTAAAIRQWT